MHYWHRVPLNAPQLPVVQLQKLNDFCSLVSQRCYTKVCWDARCSEKCVFFQEFLVFCDLFFASTVLYTTLIALIWLLRKSPTAIWRRGMGCRGLWKNTIFPEHPVSHHNMPVEALILRFHIHSVTFVTF